MHRLIKILSSVFFLGYSPLAPGTVGSLGACCIYLLIKDNLNLHTSLIVVSFIVGFLICERAQYLFGRKDSPKIVIDEFCGLFIAFYLLPFKVHLFIIGFIAYRLFDIFKPFPIARMEKLPHGYGVMVDDILAGLYTNILLRVWGQVFT